MLRREREAAVPSTLSQAERDVFQVYFTFEGESFIGYS
jgi:hypothetical protein